jgi:hypothetical protein
MKAIATLAAAAALVTLAGCDRFGGGGQAGNAANAATANTAAAGGGKESGGNAAAPAADAAAGGKLAEGGGAIAASSSGIVLDRAYLMGRWADAGEDCSKATELTSDGRFITPAGGEALWNLDGDRLTVTGNRTVIMRIVPIDQNTITVVNQDGSLGRSTRC